MQKKKNFYMNAENGMTGGIRHQAARGYPGYTVVPEGITEEAEVVSVVVLALCGKLHL